MKTLLAFETSSPVLSVALGTRQGKVKELRSRSPLRHSENLIPLVDRLLKKEKMSLDEIDALALDSGPGSFTGLRIGFSFLKGLLAVRKIPCFGALSLDMISAKIPAREGGRLGVALDAGRESIVSRFYLAHEGEWMPEGKPKLLSFPQWKAGIHKGTLLVGDALARYQEFLNPSFHEAIQPLTPQDCFPSAATLVRWFHSQNPRLWRLRTPRDFSPLYFRASEAEEKRRKLVTHAA